MFFSEYGRVFKILKHQGKKPTKASKKPNISGSEIIPIARHFSAVVFFPIFKFGVS